MKNRIQLTNNFASDLDSQIGYIEFADTSRASFVYEMLKQVPSEFRFEISYLENEDGSQSLIGVSLIGKYGPKHPVTLTRRFKDKLRVAYRNLKRPKA